MHSVIKKSFHDHLQPDAIYIAAADANSDFSFGVMLTHSN
jgi:hypothetical protein